MSPRFGIVVSRFNSEITGKLLSNCLATLKKAGVPDSRIRTLWVPSWGTTEVRMSGFAN